jgi:hypothetical protein
MGGEGQGEGEDRKVHEGGLVEKLLGRMLRKWWKVVG